ncbi:MAG: DUF6531 domain-containing protein [Sulfuricurvum sp.]|jgi:YD repeat-containing protein
MILKTLLTVLLILPCWVNADVNPENGHYLTSNHDIMHDITEAPLSFNRTYNSSSSQMGWFGHGWSGPFETTLIFSDDGSIDIRDNSSEKIIHYSPKKENNTTTYYSSQCGLTKIIPNNDGYTRIMPNDMSEIFDTQGRLTRRNYEDGKFVSLLYTGKNPTTLSNQSGQSLSLTWNENGRIANIKSSGGYKITYTYNDQNELIDYIDNIGYHIAYKYDKNHKLIHTAYNDEADVKITYLSSSMNKISSEINTDGTKRLYEYYIDPKDPNHQWNTQTTIYVPSEAIVSGSDRFVQVYDYQYSVLKSGEKYLSHYKRRINGSVAENIYYNEQGLITQKLTDEGKVRNFTYDLVLGKMTMVQEGKLITKISYDKKGNMTQIKNNQGQSFVFTYDSNDKIIRMVDTNTKRKSHRDLKMEYNKDGKPTKLSLIGEGSIIVTYDDAGEILTAESKQGSKMALKINQAFSDLLRIVSATDARK